MAAALDFAPADFQYPGLYRNTLTIVYRVGGFTAVYARNLVALVVSAVAGVTLVLVTFALTRTISSTVGVVLTSAAAALDVGLVTGSRVPAPDTLLALALATMLLVMASGRDEWWRFAAAGALAGLAAGAKFTGLTGLPVVVVWAFVVARRERRWRVAARNAVVAMASALGAFLATAPGAIANARSYGSRLIVELALQRGGQIGRVQEGYLDYVVSQAPTWEQPWLGTPLLTNEGAVLLIAALAGLWIVLRGRRGRAGVLLGAWVVGTLALFSGPGRIKAFRFLLPTLPVLFVLAGAAFEAALDSLRARWRVVLGTLAGLAALAWPGYRTLRYLAMTRNPPTQVIAREWIAKHVPAGSKVFVSPFALDNLYALPLRVATIPRPGDRQYRRPPDPANCPEQDLLFYPEMVDELRHEGISHVVLASSFDGALGPVQENLTYFPRSVAAYRGFRERLAAAGGVVLDVKGDSEGRIGPDMPSSHCSKRGAPAPPPPAGRRPS
jgi:4-amino-4-deoxy-L-arabinose transferase-like glycosyltransferase